MFFKRIDFADCRPRIDACAPRDSGGIVREMLLIAGRAYGPALADATVAPRRDG